MYCWRNDKVYSVVEIERAGVEFTPSKRCRNGQELLHAQEIQIFKQLIGWESDRKPEKHRLSEVISMFLFSRNCNIQFESLPEIPTMTLPASPSL